MNEVVMDTATMEKYIEWRSAFAESMALIAVGAQPGMQPADIKRAILSAEAKERAFFNHACAFADAANISVTRSGTIKIHPE